MEKSHQNLSSFRYSAQNNFESVDCKENSATIKDSNPGNKRNNNPRGVKHGKPSFRRKNNTYVKATRVRCYHCNGIVQRSNVCPIRGVIIVANEREEKEERK